MNAEAIAELAFKSVPAALKGSVTFTRTSTTAYNATTGVIATTTATATAECFVQGARGTGSETFVEELALRQRYVTLTVRAKQLAGFIPQSGDTATVSGSIYRVIGVDRVAPNGGTAGLYTVTVER